MALDDSTRPWGVDLGGTKIEAAIVDVRPTARAILRRRLPTESHRGYQHVIHQIVSLIEAVERESGTVRPPIIGFATPGATEPSTGLMKNSNSVCLNGQPFQRDLSQALGVTTRFENDANCFALAEATLGAAAGRGVVLGLILGTGVGSGIVVHGRALNGLHGITGEWGHNPLCGETDECYCGRRGCVETVISGPALERWYRARTGVAAPLTEITAAANRGDRDASATLARLREKFGEAIAAVINILDPDAIVIGGGIANLDLLYGEETRQSILGHLFNAELRTELLRPALGDSAGVFGAALLALADGREPAIGAR